MASDDWTAPRSSGHELDEKTVAERKAARRRSLKAADSMASLHGTKERPERFTSREHTGGRGTPRSEARLSEERKQQHTVHV